MKIPKNEFSLHISPTDLDGILFNKALEKNPKINKRSPMFILESGVVNKFSAKLHQLLKKCTDIKHYIKTLN